MMRFTILIALSISACCGQLPSSQDNSERSQYQAETKVLHDMLIDENCESLTAVARREVLGASTKDRLHIDAVKALYDKLVTRLIDCRKAKSARSSTPSITRTRSTTTRLPTTATVTSGQLQKFSGLKIEANSPIYMKYQPETIIDGSIPNTTAVFKSFCSSSDEALPYVIIDLGTIQTVVSLVFWQRYDNKKQYTSDMEFTVAPTIAGLDDESALCYQRPGTIDVRPMTFDCTTPIQGRYVKAAKFKASGQFLCFAELEIFGY